MTGKPVMFIDCPGNVTIMPSTQDVLEAAELAKREHGRLRLVVRPLGFTGDMMVGCIQLCDYREKKAGA